MVRGFYYLSLGVATTVLAGSTAKKGVIIGGPSALVTEAMADVVGPHVSWMYTYTPAPLMPWVANWTNRHNLEYMPMVETTGFDRVDGGGPCRFDPANWQGDPVCSPQDLVDVLTQVKLDFNDVNFLLGFNELYNNDDDMTPWAAVALWASHVQPAAVATGLRLVSPTGEASWEGADWLSKFLIHCANHATCELGKIESFAVHEYSCQESRWDDHFTAGTGVFPNLLKAALGAQGGRSAGQWAAYVDSRDVWVTEHNCYWESSDPHHASRDQCRRMSGQKANTHGVGSLATMERLDTISHYAIWNLYNAAASLKPNSLLTGTGAWTPMGRAFAAAGTAGPGVAVEVNCDYNVGAVTIEAESGTWASGKRAVACAVSSGGKLVAAEHGLSLAFEAPSAGQYSVHVKYTSNSDQPVCIGTAAMGNCTNYTFQTAGGTCVFPHALTVEVQAAAGLNQLQFSAPAGAGPLIDRVFVVGATPPPAPPTPTQRPNILLIIADDLGRADVGFNWPAELDGTLMAPITPNLDALAQAGVVLESFYTAAMCGPTRTSLMSGRLPMHVNTFNPEVWSTEGSLPLEMTTMADKLSSKGYRCHHVGKWHLGNALHAQLPISRGFASSFGGLSGSSDHFNHTRGYSPANLPKSMHSNYVDLWRDARPALWKGYDQKHSTALYTDEAVRIVRSHVEKTPADPLFIHMAHQAPHSPLQAPKHSVLRYGNASQVADACSSSGVCGVTSNNDPVEWQRQVYLGMVTAMDDGIGELISTLKAESIYDNTLVVFASDNGGVFKNGKPMEASNGHMLRGGKGSYYEGGVRVAAFVSGGVLPAQVRGTRRGGFVHVADLYATFGALAGYDVSDQVAAEAGLPPSDSMNMWPFLAGSSESPRLEVPLKGVSIDPAKLSPYFYKDAATLARQSPDFYGKNRPQHVLIKTINGSDFKLFVFPVYSNESLTQTRSKLYNLSADPREWTNMAAKVYAGTAAASILTAMLDRVDELTPTYYQAPVSGNFNGDKRCVDAAEQCYGGHYGPFLLRGHGSAADDGDAIAMYPSRCSELAAAAVSTTSTSTSTSTPATVPAATKGDGACQANWQASSCTTASVVCIQRGKRFACDIDREGVADEVAGTAPQT